MSDRELSVLCFASRGSKNGTLLDVSPAGLKDFLLSSSIRVKPSKSDFLKLSEDEQNQLKNGTAFIFGTSSDGSRRSGSITSRSAVALDVDAVPPEKAADLFQRIKGVPFTVLLYGTARDSAACRRLRLLVPLAADITAAEYPAVARGVAAMLLDGIATPDEASFQPQQLMYAPISFSGAPADVAEHPGALLDPATIRPAGGGSEAAQAVARQVKQQADPRTKSGLVGAFCRVYDVPAAIEKFLPDVYRPCEGNRFTFNAGSTAGGAVLYQDGQFLYSHHATDPASEQLCNSFDLVRIHLFGAQDVLAAPGVAPPSYLAMERLAREDAAVQRQVSADRAAETQADFAAVPTAPQPTLAQQATAQLVRLSAQKHPIPRTDDFRAACALVLNGHLPHTDDMCHRVAMDGLDGNIPSNAQFQVLQTRVADCFAQYGIRVGLNTTGSYLQSVAAESHAHPAEQWADRLTWDGGDRFQTLFEILGIEFDPLSQVYLRKWLVQSIALLYNTRGAYGAEIVLVLDGRQGLGKTSFFRKLSPDPSFFLEGAKLDFARKDTLLNATRYWLCELGELDSTTKKDAPSLKAFLSNRFDTERNPYAPEPPQWPRRTSFCATVNGSEFLRDETGNRRFCCIHVERLDLDRLLHLSDEFVAQIWSETKALWMRGEKFFLSADELKLTEQRNSGFQAEVDGEQELVGILDFSMPIEEWRVVPSADLARHAGVSAARVGRILKILAQKDPRLQCKPNKIQKRWLVPLKTIFSIG